MRNLLFLLLVLFIACEPDNETKDEFNIKTDSVDTQSNFTPIDIPEVNAYNVEYKIQNLGQILEYYWLDHVGVEQYEYYGYDKIQEGKDVLQTATYKHNFIALSGDTLRVRAYNYFDKIGAVVITIMVDSVNVVYEESMELGIELKAEYILQ